MKHEERIILHNEEGNSDKVYIIDFYSQDMISASMNDPFHVVTNWGAREAKTFSSQTRMFTTRIGADSYIKKIVRNKTNNDYRRKEVTGKTRFVIPNLPAPMVGLTKVEETRTGPAEPQEDYRRIEL